MRFGANSVALMGVTTVSQDGVTPATLVGITAGGVAPFSPTAYQIQNVTAGSILQSVHYTTGALTTLSTSGANRQGGGASVWAAYLASGANAGVRTNVAGLGPFPLGALGDVSELGQLVLIQSNSGTGLATYTAAGTLLYQIQATLTGFSNVRARQGYFAYPDSAGWWVRSITTGAATSVAQRADVLLTIPVVISSRVYLVEYVTAVGVSVRLATGATGYVIPNTISNSFNIDAVWLSGTTVRVGMSAGAGELPTELRVFDVNVQTGALSAGVTTTGALVFTTQPAVPTATLPTSGFTGGGTGSSRLPPGLYQHPIAEVRTGKITPPWYTGLNAALNQALGPFDLSDTSDFSGVLQPENGGTGTTTGLSDILPGAVQFSDASKLLGRGEGAGGGNGQEISLGDGLEMVGTELRATGTGSGFWTILTNGDPVTPEVVFDSDGDAISFFVPV